jgi:hypothetical protein
MFEQNLANLRKVLALVGALLVLAPSRLAAGSCTPSQISAKEAESIVLRIPLATNAKPTYAYLNDNGYYPRFYVFELRTGNRRASRETILSNGLMGRFAVNKATGDVWSADADDIHVQGSELSRIQAKVRRAHCIGKELVEAEGKRGPFED